MNDPTLIGPCTDYEHDLVDLHDGALPPERAAIVRRHLERCARCSAWAAGFAAIDARLAADIVAPALSPDFDARLRERLAALARTGRPRRPSDPSRTRARRARGLAALERQAARVLLGAAGSVATTLGVLLASRRLVEQGIGLLPALTEGPGHLMGPARWLR